jgi:hypothetical protein
MLREFSQPHWNLAPLIPSTAMLSVISDQLTAMETLNG